MKKEGIRLTPFLSMNGKAEEAIEFYKKHLEARVVFLKTNEDMKEYDPNFQYIEGHAKDIAHSVLSIGIDKIMISDEIMNGDKDLRLGNTISLCIQSASLDKTRQIFQSLTSDEKVKTVIPLAKSAFSPGYGSVLDPFGVLIQISTE